MTTHQFTFEQLTIPLYGEGILLYGEATLESDSSDDSFFYVASIKLGNETLSIPSRINSARVVNDFLFEAIAKQIEDDKCVVGQQAALEWSDVVAGNIEAVPALRRRRGMPLGYTAEISPVRSYLMEAAE